MNYNWIRRLMAFMTFTLGEEGGGAVDRGDHWVPTDDDPPAADKPAEKVEDKPAAVTDDKPAEKVEDKPAAKTDDKPAAKTDDDDDDKKGGKGKDTRVPLSRHKEILDRERAARESVERELAALKQGQQVAKANEDLTALETKVLGLESEYLKLLEKGDVPGASAKMAEIRRTEREIIQGRSTFDIAQAEARAYDRVKYDMTVERLEEAFPVLNPDHKDHDPDKAAEVAELRDGYLATGKYTRAEAVQKACKVLLGEATRKQAAAVSVDVRVDKEDVSAAVRQERKEGAVAKALDTAARQPANAAGIGENSDAAGGRLKAADVIKMDQATFAKLDDKELKKLRGDDFAG